MKSMIINKKKKFDHECFISYDHVAKQQLRCMSVGTLMVPRVKDNNPLAFS